MKKLTLEMLAQMAGVGVATVDRVLNERGGVSPETARKVLQAVRELGLKRILPDEYKHPWHIEVILSANGSFFFTRLAQDFSEAGSILGYQRVRLSRTLISEDDPHKLARHIEKCSEKRDAIIVFAHDHPAVYAALALCHSRGVPVITIVTDLPGASRLCHVGINQLQAGRTAGLLMGRTLQQPGEVIMVSGNIDYTAHRQRIAGFRQVIQQRFPAVILREVLVGQDQREKIQQLLNTYLQNSDNVVGIYNTGSGNSGISEILAHHHLLGQCIYITHELYTVTRRLLTEDAVSFVLDQHARQHAQLALDIVLRKLEKDEVPDVYLSGKVDFRLITAENHL
ncbi:LacI family DNA-binding transcriptional regulator [Erwiniaceae bacterium BAC15a-03b]|uniref:LacI family DNA-binding transcriptional regulator n=1 Tax=Winslowiella arboricola TaxID=2978220 RepID=A0A9J6PJR7_9GAMM|nr:LacI family DNA-binding transcriptional regulator [Winslowiella arboricola]MCU5776982.1 LacI family DNA-binding transcriptional regulator [Winslowiella arboricola]